MGPGSVKLTQADRFDLDFIMQHLLALREYSPAAQMKYTDPEYARTNLDQMLRAGSGWWCGNYFILVSVGGPWHSPTKFLIEEIILKCGPGPTKVTDAIASLDELATMHGCEATIVGDTQIGYMTPLYHAAGYTTLGTQLMKEHHYGRSTEVDRGQQADRSERA